MNTVIYKYRFVSTDQFSIAMPMGAKILTVQMQQGTPCLWAEVNLNAPYENRYFRIFGTGQPNPFGKYIGTYQVDEFVWHLYEIEYIG
jgi:hypothetical protein